jgi:hypothetical protein
LKFALFLPVLLVCVTYVHFRILQPVLIFPVFTSHVSFVSLVLWTVSDLCPYLLRCHTKPLFRRLSSPLPSQQQLQLLLNFDALKLTAQNLTFHEIDASAFHEGVIIVKIHDFGSAGVAPQLNFGQGRQVLARELLEA